MQMSFGLWVQGDANMPLCPPRGHPVFCHGHHTTSLKTRLHHAVQQAELRNMGTSQLCAELMLVCGSMWGWHSLHLTAATSRIFLLKSLLPDLPCHQHFAHLLYVLQRCSCHKGTISTFGWC